MTFPFGFSVRIEDIIRPQNFPSKITFPSFHLLTIGLIILFAQAFNNSLSLRGFRSSRLSFFPSSCGLRSLRLPSFPTLFPCVGQHKCSLSSSSLGSWSVTSSDPSSTTGSESFDPQVSFNSFSIPRCCSVVFSRSALPSLCPFLFPSPSSSIMPDLGDVTIDFTIVNPGVDVNGGFNHAARAALTGDGLAKVRERACRTNLST